MPRLPLIAGLLAGMACGLLLGNTHRAEADPTAPGRVSQAPVRLDLHASCPTLADQLEERLDEVWRRERVFGDVQVQLVIDNGRVDAVQTQGRLGLLNHAVRAAARHLSCGPQAPAGRHVFSFNVSFIDPDRRAQGGVTVAEIKR